MNLHFKWHSALAGILLKTLLIGCTSMPAETGKSYATLGSIEVLDERLHAVLDPNAKIEVLASGFSWSEGPVWVPELNSLLFSEVPLNKIYRWNEEDSISTFLQPSGNSGFAPASSGEGSNGLALDPDGNLLLCQHGDRRVARLEKVDPSSSFQTLVQKFGAKRFNSPNDLTVASNGTLYFTDPPYGLAGQDGDSLKELSFNGVYQLADSNVTLIDSTLTRPNGIALSPDGTRLIVANSDPEIAIWRSYDLSTSPIQSKLLYDATDMVGKRPGLADGLKINSLGIIFATGPGGVLVLTMEGAHLGTILTNKHTSNCALGANEKVLYITADDLLLRVALK